MFKHCAWLAMLTASLLSEVWAQEAIPPENRPKVRSIHFEGSTSFEEATLLKRLRLMRVGSAFQPGGLDADIELNLKSFLKEHGFMSSEVRWQTTPEPDGTVDVTVEVSEGPQYRLGTLEFEGPTVFPREQIRALIDLREGDILNFTKLKAGLDQLKHMYSDDGYINWSYLPEVNTSGTKMNLRFTIVEDQQFRLGSVGFVGCGDQEEENQLRSLIKLRPGEVFRMSEVEAGVIAINELDRFKTIGEADFVIYPDEKTGLISVVFWLKPKE